MVLTVQSKTSSRNARSRAKSYHKAVGLHFLLGNVVLLSILFIYHSYRGLPIPVLDHALVDAPVQRDPIQPSDTGQNAGTSPAASWNRIPDNETRDFYEELRKINATIVVDGVRFPQPQLIHRGTSGMGHRLLRMSGAYHSARLLKYSHLSATWGIDCRSVGGEPRDIFDHLFGPGPIVTEHARRTANTTNHPQLSPSPPSSSSPSARAARATAPPRGYPNMLQIEPNRTSATRISNECPGYTQLHWCHRGSGKTTRAELVYEKAVSDVEFYHQLRALYRFNDVVEGFIKHHSFAERLVLGIHVRAGNGESGDFKKKKRSFWDLDAWIENVAISLKELADRMGAHRQKDPSKPSLPPLLFVATDEETVVEKFQNATKPLGISAVAFPQFRLHSGGGVTYKDDYKFDSVTPGLCHDVWAFQFTDMVLLGASDAVVAGRYSSFTQALPLVTVLSDSIMRAPPPPPSMTMNEYFEYFQIHQTAAQARMTKAEAARSQDEKYSHRLFCDSSVLGDSLECYDDYFEWLLSRKFGRKVQQDVGNNQTAWMTYRKEVQVPCFPMTQIHEYDQMHGYNNRTR